MSFFSGQSKSTSEPLENLFYRIPKVFKTFLSFWTLTRLETSSEESIVIKKPTENWTQKLPNFQVIFITTWAITSTLAKLLISWKQEGKKVTGLLVEQEKIASGPFLFLFFQELKKFRTSSTTFWSTSLGLIPSLIITTGMVGCYEFQQYPWALVVV